MDVSIKQLFEEEKCVNLFKNFMIDPEKLTDEEKSLFCILLGFFAEGKSIHDLRDSKAIKDLKVWYEKHFGKSPDNDQLRLFKKQLFSELGFLLNIGKYAPRHDWKKPYQNLINY